MLSIFTLTVLGAFGASNVLTDVGDRSDEDDDRATTGSMTIFSLKVSGVKRT
jgi:hypothetical protein